MGTMDRTRPHRASGLRDALAGVALLAAVTAPLPALAQDAAAPAVGTVAPTAPEPVLEQAAIDLLKKVSDTLAAAKSFIVEVKDMRQVPSSAGQMLTFINSAEITIERPDKMRADAVIGGVDTVFVYDGKALSILDEEKNLYTSVEAPGTLDTVFNLVAAKHGINFAVSDFLANDPYAILGKDLTSAYEGPATEIDGDPVRHLVFSTPGVDWQLWVDPDTNLPRLFVATYVDEPGQPHFVVGFEDWEIDEKPDAGDFVLDPPSDAVKIEPLPAAQQ